ncbi:MAG: hypothetical protein ACK6BG_13815 [Cyanobacteriota bacterium]
MGKLQALALAVVWAVIGPAAGIACPGRGEVRDATPEAIRAFAQSKGMGVLTFLGYYAAGYEDAARMTSQAAQILEGQDPTRTLINIGATADGIGVIYPLAKRRGFTTIGVVSSRAREAGVSFSSCVDHVFVVKDDTWGGLLPGRGELSPTSKAVVESSTAMVAIGGGEVARDELLAAWRLGKSVVFLPADMNHARARAKARRQGQPPPSDFRGAVHAALEGGSGRDGRF